jgi:CDP-diacylglycerol--serine O-phosphatidyltransferase
MVSFGLAPAMLAFNWSLKSLGDLSPLAGKLGWLAAFVYIACAALRLARFNAQAGLEDRTYFQGLASPAAALTVAATVWFFVDRGIPGESVRVLLWFVTLFVGVLMFSRVRYFSFKTISFAERVPITGIFLVMLALVLLAVDPPAVSVIIGLSYITSGLVLTLVGRRKRMARRRLMHRRRQARQAAAELRRERDGDTAASHPDENGDDG